MKQRRCQPLFYFNSWRYCYVCVSAENVVQAQIKYNPLQRMRLHNALEAQAKQ
jgi:hypothetical protein